MTQTTSLATPKTSMLSAWVDARHDNLPAAIDVLFNRFDGMYPGKFRAHFTGEQSIANWRSAWAQAFAEEGFLMEEIALGLRVCRRSSDWPPSLPEFLKMCRASIDPESAFREAVSQMANRSMGIPDAWSHPAIYWAAVEFGTWDLHSVAYARCKARWDRILAAKWGERCAPVPVALLALPSPGETTPDPETIARLIAGARSVIKRVAA